MKNFISCIAIIMALISLPSLAQRDTRTSPSVNLEKYITLTVKTGQQIKLDFKASVDNTPVRIVSGQNTKEITIGKKWYDGNKESKFSVNSDGNTMIIYGDIVAFACGKNNTNLTAVDISNNSDLTELSCPNNNLTTLDISKNSNLTELKCDTNYIKSLNATNLTKLKLLDCSSNGIVDLILNNCSALNKLNCSNNKILNLNLTDNTNLREINCSYNQMISLDLSNKSYLSVVKCNHNKLSIINLIKSPEVLSIRCNNNQLKSLDLSSCNKLQSLYCYDNSLTKDAMNELYCSLPDRMNITTGECYPVNKESDINHSDIISATSKNARNKNWEVYYYNDSKTPQDTVPNNGNFICSKINMNRYIELTVEKGYDINFNVKGNREKTSIRVVAGNYTMDYDLDTMMNFTKISFPAKGTNITIYGNIASFDCSGNSHIINEINVSKSNQLKYLTCHNNQLKKLYLGHNNNLDELWCFNNQLSELDISGNKHLKVLQCDNNQLNKLDISNNPELKVLRCNNNQLSEIITGDNSNLTSLKCHKNHLTSLDISSCTLLEELLCFNNQIISLDVSNNTLLSKLLCSDNALSSLNVSRNTKLYVLDCANNKISSLNISNSPKIDLLKCQNNQLTSLDLSVNTKLINFWCYGNPFTTESMNKLYCSLPEKQAGSISFCYPLNTPEDTYYPIISAATSDIARKKGWKVVFFNNNASPDNDIPNTGDFDCVTIKPEPNLNKFIQLRVEKGKNIALNFKSLKDNTPIRIISGKNIKDTLAYLNWYSDTSKVFFVKSDDTKITVYGDIIGFDCGNNGVSVTGLDSKENLLLTELICDGNNISDIDLNKNIELTNVNCSNNKLKSIDLSMNTKLSTIDLSNNSLTKIDLNKNAECKNVVFYGNPITTAIANEIYCSLPDRKKMSAVNLYMVNKPSDADYSTISAATSDNARAKNWKILFYNEGNTPQNNIPNGGNYNCNSSVDEIRFSGITVFPNPANDKVQIQLDEEVNEMLIIVDLSGRALLTSDVVSGRATIDISKLTAGTYFIMVGNRVEKLTVK